MTHQPNNVSAAGVLLPCPFCGATPDLPDALGTQYEIECDCGMARSSVQISDSMTLEERQSGWDSLTLKFDAQYVERAKEEAIAAWNRRAAASAQATQAVEQPAYVFLVPGDVIRAADERYSSTHHKWKPIAPLYVGSTVDASTRPVRRLAAPSPAAREAGNGVISGHAIEELFFKWSEYTTELGEAVSRKNIDGFVSDLRALLREAGSRS